MIKLTLKEQPHVPLEAEILSPNVMQNLSRDEICALPVLLGKRQRRLDDFFDIEGEASRSLEVHGDMSRVKWIGRGMSCGEINIVGNAGMHLGAFMKSGSISVSGNASDWVGAEMSGGQIRIAGNAGGQIGAAYRGSLSGMSNGTIIIEGSAGLEVGMRMKRGTIAIKGSAKDFAGLEMKGGTLVLGGAELRTGAWMFRGTIICLTPVSPLPTFARGGHSASPILSLIARHLRSQGLAMPGLDFPVGHNAAGSFLMYHGDAAVQGKGEIFQWQPAASWAPSAKPTSWLIEAGVQIIVENE